MNQELQKRTEEWMALGRQTLEQRQKAELFYEQKLMRSIVSEYIANNKEKIKEHVKYLIMSVGTSYEPLVLNISLLQPEKILFLYTSKSEEMLDKVMEMCGLKMSQVQKSKVNETEPVDIYREIKKCYLEWERPEKIYIDFTGGTKAMSAAAALAGAVINVQMIYVGNNRYLPDFRKPFPGSERLFFIANPMDVFGDLEIDKAYALFEQYNYAGAREKLYELKEEVPDPVARQELNLVYLLAKTYEEWDSLDFEQAFSTMSQLRKEIIRDRKNDIRFVLSDFLDTLTAQEEMLKSLKDIPALTKNKKAMDILKNDCYIVPLMFTMYQNAMIREHQEKYDMATLLLYRLLEMIEQRRLALYNLFVSKMDYGKLIIEGRTISEEELSQLKEKVISIIMQVFGKCHSTNLPDRVSLLEGFILLAALGDPIVGQNQKTISQLKRIRAMVELRNNSIFAHGLAPAVRSDYVKFRQFVKELFQNFCTLENVDFDTFEEQIKWISPLKSQYYRKR